MDYNLFLEWIYKLFSGFASVGSWITTPITIGSLSIAPIWLLGSTGLIAFISIAIVKWVLS